MALKRSGLWFSLPGGSLVNLEGIYGWECPRQKEIVFIGSFWQNYFRGFVILTHPAGKGGYCSLLFYCPRTKGGRRQSSFEGAFNRLVLCGFLPLFIHLSQTSQSQRIAWLTSSCIYRPNLTQIDAEFKVTITQGVQNEVVYQRNIYRV